MTIIGAAARISSGHSPKAQKAYDRVIAVVQRLKTNRGKR